MLSLSQLVSAVVLIAVAVIALGMSSEVLSELQEREDFVGVGGVEGTNATHTWNVSAEGIGALGTGAELIPTIGNILITAVVVGVAPR